MLEPFFADQPYLSVLYENDVAIWLERQLRWVVHYPWFVLQLLVIWLINARLLLRSYGAERLFWEDRWNVQLGSMWSVGTLVGTSLFVWYLLDVPTTFVTFVDNHQWTHNFTLFPNAPDTEITYVGSYLFVGMTCFLLLLIATKLVQVARQPTGTRLQFVQARGWFGAGLLGYALAYPTATLLYLLDNALGVRNWIQKSAFFEGQLFLSGGDFPYWHPVEYFSTPSSSASLHAIAAYLGIVNVLILFVGLVADWLVRRRNRRRVAFGPAMLVCQALIFVDLFFGWWVFNVQKQGIVLLLGLGFLILWNLKRWTWKRYRLPGLEPAYTTAPVSLAQYPPTTPTPLLDDITTLHAHINQMHEQKIERPKLIVVSVSGGGIRAATWAPLVLEQLDAMIPQFRQRVRLISGASGGMVGASLWVGDDAHGTTRAFHDPDGLGFYSGVAAQQSLMPVVRTMLLHDWSTNLLIPPGRWTASERGRELETQWELIADTRFGRANNPFRRTFFELQATEANGTRPSMVFAPTCIEDTRRMIMSNLALEHLLVANGPDGAGNIVQHARSCFEFFRLFPQSHRAVSLATAARLNASFPLISPLVALPTDPPRRTMDAGLFDNFGLEFIARWLLYHRNVFKERKVDVALIQIRAFPLRDEGNQLDHANFPNMRSLDPMVILSEAVATLSAPMGALMRGRGDMSYQRNHALVNVVANELRSSGVDFRNFCFELDAEASLNWYLAAVERRAIAAGWAAVQAEATALQQWLR